MKLSVKPSSRHGDGVFAEQPFQPGDIIETCRFLIASTLDPALIDYYSKWNATPVLLLGYGSLYNHSEQPNASFDFDNDKHLVVLTATFLIHPGDEILIGYGRNWFAARDRQLVTEASIFRRLVWRFGLVALGLVALLQCLH